MSISGLLSNPDGVFAPYSDLLCATQSCACSELARVLAYSIMILSIRYEFGQTAVVRLRSVRIARYSWEL